jgi:hypothetical protein
MIKATSVVNEKYFYKKTDDGKSNVSCVIKHYQARWLPICVWEETSSNLGCDTDYPD